MREATYKKVMQAIELLPEQYSFILFDGYRPIQVQQYLFNHYYEEMRKVYPHFTENEILGETLKYVAFPTMNDDRPAPHLTGGAVDLTLGDQEGNPLNMGTDFDEMHESSATDYFEAHPGVNDEARKIVGYFITVCGKSDSRTIQQSGGTMITAILCGQSV